MNGGTTEKHYTINQLAELAGISVRALHHYDHIGLLVPQRQPNGYRTYGPAEVDRLQLILLYRATGMSLADIGHCLNDPVAETHTQLLRQRDRLIAQRKELDTLIATVDRTISCTEGVDEMSDEEKFEGMKRERIADNERRYGEEARERYGDAQVDAGNARLMGMTREEYAATQDLEQRIKDTLHEAMEADDPAGPLAQKACDLHRTWLCTFWKEGTYSKQAHAGLAEMYLADDRFRAYYDEVAPGATQFLHDALMVYCRD